MAEVSHVTPWRGARRGGGGIEPPSRSSSGGRGGLRAVEHPTCGPRPAPPDSVIRSKPPGEQKEGVLRPPTDNRDVARFVYPAKRLGRLRVSIPTHHQSRHHKVGAVGEYAEGGTERQPDGERELARVGDLVDRESGQAAPGLGLTTWPNEEGLFPVDESAEEQLS